MVARCNVVLVDKPSRRPPCKVHARRRARQYMPSPASTARRACCSMSTAEAPPVPASMSQEQRSPSLTDRSMAQVLGESENDETPGVHQPVWTNAGVCERLPRGVREQHLGGGVRGRRSDGVSPIPASSASALTLAANLQPATRREWPSGQPMACAAEDGCVVEPNTGCELGGHTGERSGAPGCSFAKNGDLSCSRRRAPADARLDPHVAPEAVASDRSLADDVAHRDDGIEVEGASARMYAVHGQFGESRP